MLESFRNSSESKAKTELFILMNYEKEFITLGRGKACEVVMKDKSVSKFHCNLKIKRDCVEIYDLNSKAGVFVKFSSARLPLITETVVNLVTKGVLLELRTTRGWFLGAFNCFLNLIHPPLFVPYDYSAYNWGLKKEKEDALEIQMVDQENIGIFKESKDGVKNNSENYSMNNRLQNNTFFGMIESIDNVQRNRFSNAIVEIPEEEDEE